MEKKLSNLLSREFRFLARPLNFWSRLLLLLSAAAIFTALFFPLWQMHLVAPQYSDGLDLFIYCYKIVGGGLNGQHLVEINNLNHYIGMASIVQADFLEMRWMPFVFGLIILMILRSVVFGQMGNLVDLFAVYCYFGVFSIGSFWYPPLPIWAQSRPARADAHHAVHATPPRHETNREFPRVQLPAARRLPTLFFGVAYRTRRWFAKEYARKETHRPCDEATRCCRVSCYTFCVASSATP